LLGGQASDIAGCGNEDILGAGPTKGCRHGISGYNASHRGWNRVGDAGLDRRTRDAFDRRRDCRCANRNHEGLSTVFAVVDGVYPPPEGYRSLASITAVVNDNRSNHCVPSHERSLQKLAPPPTPSLLLDWQ
jgi:hypothetical protein